MEQRIIHHITQDINLAREIINNSPFLNFPETKDRNILYIAKLIQKERHKLEDIENGK